VEDDLDSEWFPGTFSDDSQLLRSESHPHLRLEECLVSIPKMYPGDTVWWHRDVSPLVILKPLRAYIVIVGRCAMRLR
jgi:hypothetical protein